MVAGDIPHHGQDKTDDLNTPFLNEITNHQPQQTTQVALAAHSAAGQQYKSKVAANSSGAAQSSSGRSGLVSIALAADSFFGCNPKQQFQTAMWQSRNVDVFTTCSKISIRDIKKFGYRPFWPAILNSKNREVGTK